LQIGKHNPPEINLSRFQITRQITIPGASTATEVAALTEPPSSTCSRHWPDHIIRRIIFGQKDTAKPLLMSVVFPNVIVEEMLKTARHITIAKESTTMPDGITSPPRPHLTRLERIACCVIRGKENMKVTNHTRVGHHQAAAKVRLERHRPHDMANAGWLHGNIRTVCRTSFNLPDPNHISQAFFSADVFGQI